MGGCGRDSSSALSIVQPDTSAGWSVPAVSYLLWCLFSRTPPRPPISSCVCLIKPTQVWNTLKKKPVSITRNAHAPRNTSPAAAAAASAAAADGGEQQPPAAGSWATANVDTPAWIQSVAVAPLSDLVASGAGDGFIRLWGVQPSKHGGAGTLRQVRLSCWLCGVEAWSGWRHFRHLCQQWPAMRRFAMACLLCHLRPRGVLCVLVSRAVQVGALPAAGFVNGLALGKSGTLAVAALGQVRCTCGPTACTFRLQSEASRDSQLHVYLARYAQACVGLDYNSDTCIVPDGAFAGAAPGALGAHRVGAQRAAGAQVELGRRGHGQQRRERGVIAVGKGERCCPVAVQLVKPGVRVQNPMHDGDLRKRLVSTHKHLLRKHLELNSRPVALVPLPLLLWCPPSSPHSIQLLLKRVSIPSTLGLQPRHQPIR